MASEKTSKVDAGYLHVLNTNYVCGDCAFERMVLGTAKCALYGSGASISSSGGGCNLFVIRPKRRFVQPWINGTSKQATGYTENSEGFSCKRCEHKDPSGKKCLKVDESSPGRDPGEIHPDGCCNLWEADPKRAKMSDSTLEKLQGSGGKRFYGEGDQK